MTNGNEKENPQATKTPAQGTADVGAPPAEATDLDLAAKLDQALAEIARLQDERLRALAEIENTRRRAARDRQEAGQYAISNFARDLLSVADNLDRALASVTTADRQADPRLEALVGGVEMTQKELLAVLDRNGIRAMTAHGQPFDPHVHEAMFEIPDESVAHGTVVQVLQSGYTIHDRTLRPARVGIARGGPKPSASTPEPAPQSDEDKLAYADGGGAYTQTETATGGRIDERS